MRRHHSSARQAIDSSVIGRRGERAFEDLCERARRKPEPDMTGKDYLVEFPFEDPEGIYTLDNRPIPLSCYVQVKTATYKTERVKIYLKAAEYLIDNDMISFLGTDCHHLGHLETLRKTLTEKYMHKVLASGKLLNATL